MSQHCCDFFLLTLLHKRVIQHNALVLEEAVHVGVAVCTAGGTINEEQLGQWELEGSGQALNLFPAAKQLWVNRN